MARIPLTRFFADGENLVFRYQEMVKNGKIPKPTVVHIPDILVWEPSLTDTICFDLLRATYYTSITGDTSFIQSTRKKISNIEYQFQYSPDNDIPPGTGTLVPQVFTKLRQSRKSRAVDIQITIDMLRHAIRSDADEFVLLTGDGDFEPLIREVMAAGISVRVMAFSLGLSSNLEVCTDDFDLLDDYFFQQKEKTP